jgi:hypothetical protein
MTETALTEILNYIDAEIGKIPANSLKDNKVAALIAGMQYVKAYVISRLPKEREDIKDAYREGRHDEHNNTNSDSEDYFTQTFTQYKTDGTETK